MLKLCENTLTSTCCDQCWCPNGIMSSLRQGSTHNDDSTGNCAWRIDDENPRGASSSELFLFDPLNVDDHSDSDTFKSLGVFF